MNVKIGVTIVLSFVCASLFGQTENGYLEWTDTTGQYSVVAELISLENEAVVLKKESGVIVKIPLAKLSPEHAERARRMAAGPVVETPEVQPAKIEESDDPFDLAPKDKRTMDDEVFPLYAEMQLSESTRKIIQEKLDGMETPGKTRMWHFVRPFWIAHGGSNPEIHISGTTPKVVFDGTKPSSPLFPSPISKELKLDFIAPLGLIGGGLGIVVCGIWFLVAMFRVSAWWMVCYIGAWFALGHIGYSGVVALIFVVMNWDKAKGPFVWSILTVVIFLAAFFFLPSWAPDYAVLEQALIYTQ